MNCPTRTAERVDVAIVGASLAGCAAATLLGRAGVRVALIDKHAGQDAYKRLCGHYIQASARPVIDRLGLRGAIEAAGGVRNGVDMWTRWGLIADPVPLVGRPHGYSIRRSKLDPLIRRAALETSEVEYSPGLECVGLRGDEGGISGIDVRDRSGHVAQINARLVIGADGRDSSVARLAGASEQRATNARFCYMAYFTGVGLPPESNGRFWILDPDVAIASPNDDGYTVLAAFVHKRDLPEFRTDRAGALRRLFGRLPDGPNLDVAEQAGKMLGYTDYGLILRQPAPRPGVALIGDAGLTSDPLMAIGCGWALQSAAWLADAVVPALAGAEPLHRGLSRYRRLRRRRLEPHHRMLVADARGVKLNPIQRLLFSSAARDQRMAELVHRYAARSIPPHKLLAPRALARGQLRTQSRSQPASIGGSTMPKHRPASHSAR